MRLFPFALAAMCCAMLGGFGTLHAAVVDVKKLEYIAENSVETLADTEKHFKKLVHTGVKFALPYLIESATEIRISGKCMQGLLMLMKGTMDLKSWAVRMLDAIGKPSAGILEGTATAMGDYDECLEITAPRRMRPAPTPPYQPNQIAFYGQYCVVQIHLPDSIRKAALEYQTGNRSNSELANSKTFLRELVKIAPRADVAELRLGVCIPSVCSNSDLQTIVDEVASMVKFSATVVRCEIKESQKIEKETILSLCLVALVIVIVTIGTSLEFYHRFMLSAANVRKKSQIERILLVFAAPRNAKKLFSLESRNSPMISSLRGIKLICVCLYVVVWTYATPNDFHFLKYRSAFQFYKFFEEWWFTIFANASAGVDTLFLIAGLHVSYRLWMKTKERHTIVSIPKFILKWYIRFSLSQVVVIVLFMCLPLLGYGPLWNDVVAPAIQNCKQRWWMNILAINNFFSSEETCLPHTWLICCLMHMLILAPIVLFILSKSTSLGIFVNVILILGCSAAIAIVTLMNELPPTPAFYFLSFVNIKAIWEKLFIQAYDHIGAFCLGMLLGFFFSRNEKVNLKRTTVIFGWCCSVLCLVSVMCGLYGYRNGEKMKTSLSAIYAATHRLAWSAGSAWIIFACAYGYGGFVKTILSSKLFIPFERLANLIYLLHPLVLYLHEGQLRERMYMAHLDQAMFATACIVFTVVLSTIVYICCVAPFLRLEKAMWYYTSSKKLDNVTDNHLAKIKEGISSNIDICKDKFQYLRNSGRMQIKEEKILKT